MNLNTSSAPANKKKEGSRNEKRFCCTRLKSRITLLRLISLPTLSLSLYIFPPTSFPTFVLPEAPRLLYPGGREPPDKNPGAGEGDREDDLITSNNFPPRLEREKERMRTLEAKKTKVNDSGARSCGKEEVPARIYIFYGGVIQPTKRVWCFNAYAILITQLLLSYVA